jgi:hypothetical protein
MPLVSGFNPPRPLLRPVTQAVERGDERATTTCASPEHASPGKGRLVRRAGTLVAASWDEALVAAADGLTPIAARNGPDAVATFGQCLVDEREGLSVVVTLRPPAPSER